MWENHAHEWDLLSQGRTEGIAEGIAKEKAKTEAELERADRLSRLLRSKGEIDLAFAVYTDKELRERLSKEFGIN
ncbi:MAG: hypothetical protein J5736_04645 [Bacilli bacterium]|nr:hypothetical protein [Bacilli bacterium]